MHRSVTTLALGAAAALAFAAAAQAADITISIAVERDAHRWVAYDGDDDGERRSIQAPGRSGYHDDHRYYGRPVPERPHWDRPHWQRPVAARPHWDDDCRLIIKKRVNPWGEVTVTRIRRCG